MIVHEIPMNETVSIYSHRPPTRPTCRYISVSHTFVQSDVVNYTKGFLCSSAMAVATDNSSSFSNLAKLNFIY